ncbi:MAG: magnesium transporter MgtE N-terminal domain-containing protein, partial [Candidatus Dormibacteraceae bacterium]
VDVSSARLVRVRDLLLEGNAANWEVTAVRPVPVPTFWTLLRWLFKRTEPSTEEIPWSHVEPLIGHVPSAAHHLPLFRLMRLHPADIADIVEQASHEQGEEILTAVHQDRELEADIFQELNTEHQLEFLRERSDQEAATVLANMEADAAADLLMKLDQEHRRPVLELLPDKQQRRVRKLLGYHPETAGGLMSPQFIALPEKFNVAKALEHIKTTDELPEILTEIYTLSDGHLSGSIPIARLLRADPLTQLADLVIETPVAVHPATDLPAIAVQMADYNLAGLPVIDEAGQLLGVITYDDLIETMLPTGWRWRGRPGPAHPASDLSEELPIPRS